jgi:hypothetical protein
VQLLAGDAATLWPASGQLIDVLTTAARGWFHELRREYAADLEAAPVQVTSVLNGAFADMLTGTAPMIPFEGCRA